MNIFEQNIPEPSQSSGDVQLSQKEIGNFRNLVKSGVDPKEAGLMILKVRRKDQWAPAEIKEGILDRIGSQLSERGSKIGEAFKKGVVTGETTPAKAALSAFSQAAVAPFDVLGEGLITAIKQTGKGIAAISPEPLREVGRHIARGAEITGEAILESDIGKQGIVALGEGVESYTIWKEENPDSAEALESVFRIASVFPVAKGAKVVKEAAGEAVEATAKVAGKAGEALVESSEKKVFKTQDDFLTDLVQPKQTQKVRAEAIREWRVTEWEGIFESRTIELTPQEIRIKETVSNVEGVSPNNTLLENSNILNDDISKKAIQLEKDIAKNNTIIPRIEIISRVNKTRESLRDNIFIWTEANPAIDRMQEEMIRLINDKPGQALSILKSRKEFDKWLTSQKWSSFFESDKQNAIKTAATEFRISMNNLLDEKVADVAIKKSLSDQTNLFRAVKNVSDKAAVEAGSKVGRLVDKVKNKLNLKSDALAGIALLSGTAGAGVAAAALPVVSLPIAIAYWAKKFITSPTVKKALGETLKKVNKLLVKEKDNADLINLKKEIEYIIDPEDIKKFGSGFKEGFAEPSKVISSDVTLGIWPKVAKGIEKGIESVKNPVVNKRTWETLSEVVDKLRKSGWDKKDIEKFKKDILSESKDKVIKSDFETGTLTSLNPTGGLYVEYNPSKINKLKLGDNITTLDKTSGKNPNDVVTIYRWTVKSQKDIAPGDFITTNYDLAKSYAGEGKVISKDVKYSHILDDINESLWEEYIYKPNK